MTTPSKIPSKVLGANGKPAAYFLYPSPRHNLKSYRPRYYLSNTNKSNVSSYDRWEMVNYSRQIFAQIPEVGGAIRQKNQWAFGDAWDPHYLGNNKKWGEEASEFLRELFFPNADLRGQPYNFITDMIVSGMAQDFDGDDVMLLTEDENHFPKIAFVPAPRISSGQDYAGSTVASRYAGGSATQNVISGGRFDGANIFDGVIMDRNSRFLGVRVVNEDNSWNDISSFNCDLRYDPEWCDQGRGIPLLGRPMLEWLDFQDTRQFLKRALKRAAAMAITAHVRGGDAGTAGLTPVQMEEMTPADTTLQNLAGKNITEQKFYTEELEGGELYYLDSDAGEEIKGVPYEVPHPNVDMFIKDIVRGGLLSIGWFYELINLSDTGRAATRLVCDQANLSIWNRQRALYPRWKRAITYAVAKAMKYGFISKNDDWRDASRWEPGLPKEISVDAGNDEQADREGMKMGITNKALVAQKKGRHWTEIDAQRDKELSAQIDRAANLVAHAREKGWELPFDKAMELLEQRSPNFSAAVTSAPEPEPADPEKETP